jgi:hypothetical protein
MKRIAFTCLFALSALLVSAQKDNSAKWMEYINQQFKLHNQYNLQYWIEGENLKSKSMYFEVTYPLKDLAPVYFTKRGDKDYVINFSCKSGDCIAAYDLDDKKTNYKPTFTVNMEADENTTNKVVEYFNMLREQNAGGQNTTKSSKSGSNITSDLEFINKQMKKCNPYDLQFSVDMDRKVLKSRSVYFEVTYYPQTLKPVELNTTGNETSLIKFSCKNGVTCLISIDIEDRKSEMKEFYSVNFNCSSQDGAKMVEAFNRILQNLEK